MARDVMYYFDKKSPYERHELGEIQTDFNMSMTIDGSKDSMQVQVFNFEEKEITPNTLLYHSATNTWWVVARDIVKRNAHEQGFYYFHNLTINGANNLLGVRDLTDCGFNDKTYTIDTFIKRLFKLSTFEFPFTIDYGNNVDETKQVDYIKSFENYTPLSALREFLNGYNCDFKISFVTRTETTHTYIESAIVKIIPRTGDIDLEVLDIDDFDDVRETKTANKESYASTVVSNVQNVVSTEAKTYPQIGGTALSGDAYDTASKDLFFRMPSPIFDIVWLRAMSKIRFIYEYESGGAHAHHIGRFFYPQSRASFELALEELVDYIRNLYGSPAPDLELTDEQKEQIWKQCLGASQVTFYSNGFVYNPIDGKDYKKPETPYIASMKYDVSGNTHLYRNMLLTDKALKDGMNEGSRRALYFERGGDRISGYGIFWNTGQLDHAQDTERADRCDLKLYGFSNNLIPTSIIPTRPAEPYSERIFICYNATTDGDENIINRIDRDMTMWQVKYIPMSDIKIKQDNARNDLDIHIYNQNGKINDSVALSKIFDGYAKEIQSDNITRYMHYTNFSDIPQVGQLVSKGNDMYVINNISYDFYTNEEDTNGNLGYYIECEFTMSKYIATKSLMVNPNSNIRDYGIPQNNNVKRRQTYRDYFEFSLTPDTQANVDTPYVALPNYVQLGIGTVPREYDHTAVMKIDYDEPINEHTSWYYQLPSIAYVMNKTLYEIVDFKDNNIIGYDLQNAWSGFNMSKLFDNATRNIITPISYVDYNGKVKGITLQMVNPNNLSSMYDTILENYGSYNIQTLSSHCFVGEDFYYGKYNTNFTSASPTFVELSANSGYVTYENFETILRVPLSQITFLHDNVDYSTVVIENIVSAIWTGETQHSMTIATSQIVEINGEYYLEIVDASGDYSSYGVYIWLTCSYTYYTQVYQGAIDLKDYEIKELDYNKDAIEVPVFEYVLQLGDTEEVEVGDKILTNETGKLFMYGTYFANTKVTQLNAKKFVRSVGATSFEITGNEDYSYGYRLTTAYTPIITYEQNNTKMRIKFYDNQRALFYGDSTQEKIDFQEIEVPTPSTPQISKNFLIGRDVVIWRHTIKNMHRDTETGDTTVDYDSDVMFIIHHPTEDNFDGNDLLIDINYYKLF